MVFRKTIIQVYSANNQFGFNDFVRGTLRLFNYTHDRNIDLKINISGSEFEPYLYVSNYNYDAVNIKPRVYFNETDKKLLITDLDAFLTSSDTIMVVTSNVTLDRHDIYNTSYLAFDNLVKYNQALYYAAEAKVRANLLLRTNSDNLKYGYKIIYVEKDDKQFKSTVRYMASLANQIRNSVNLNYDIMVLSNSIQFRTILSEYIEMSSFVVKNIDDSNISIGPNSSLPNISDIITDYLILLNAKKIYHFSHTIDLPSYTIPSITLKNISTELYNDVVNTNNITWNLKKTNTPLQHQTLTLVGTPPLTYIPQYDASGNRFLGNSILQNPSGIVLDNSGLIYIADTANHRICILDSSNNLLTLAGTGTAGFINGKQYTAAFNRPTAIVMDNNGNIYVADTGNNAIRIIEKNVVYDFNRNIISVYYVVGTIVGGGPGQTTPVTLTGFASGALLNAPQGIALDISGNLYISDTGNHRICKLTRSANLSTISGISTIGGTLGFVPGYINGSLGEASFNRPTGLIVDTIGNIYIADTGNNVIRKIDIAGNVTTFAGNAQASFNDGPSSVASFNKPTGIIMDSMDVFYISDSGNNSIRRISPDGIVSLVAGSPMQLPGSIDGYGDRYYDGGIVPFNKRATFCGPSSIFVDTSRNLFFTDTLNNTVRKIMPLFSTPINIQPIPIQTFKIINAPGVAYTLGPTLSQQEPNMQLIQGHRRGAR